jgi:hypothetical protein
VALVAYRENEMKRWRWILLDPPLKPWWAVHVWNLVGTTLFVAVAFWYGNSVGIAAMSAFWGAANINALSAILVRREMEREGYSFDVATDPADSNG